MTETTMSERFWAKVQKGDGCWLWIAGKDGAGYGCFAISRRVQVRAHRFAYESVFGPIPDGLVLDHLCRTPACVNPSHLDPVTSGENVLRGFSAPAVNARRRCCPRGHEYRTVQTGRTSGKRYCPECQNEARRQRRAAARRAA